MSLSPLQRLALALIALPLALYAWLLAVRMYGPNYDFVTPLLALVAVGSGVLAVAARGGLRLAFVVPATVAYACALAFWFDLALASSGCPVENAACVEAATRDVIEDARRPLPLLVVSVIPLGLALAAGARGSGRLGWACRGLAVGVALPTLAFLGRAAGVGVHIPVPPPPFAAPGPTPRPSPSSEPTAQ